MNENRQKSTDSPQATWHRPDVLLASGCGTGFLPVAPGTWASALAVPVAWFIVQGGGRLALGAAALAVLIVGIWVSDRLVKKHGARDPAYIVIDEIAGQWIALLAVAPDPMLYAVGFVLFRLADIFKPWPVSWAETLPGGYGVMIDDVLAGVYAAIGVYLVALFL